MAAIVGTLIMGYRADYLKGWQAAVSQMGTKDRGHSVLPFLTKDARQFYKGLANQGITKETPVQLAGAVGARLLTDVGTDATRHLYWRYNHPMALADKAAEQVMFEFNDEFTRAEFVNIVEPVLREVKGRRGITDFRVVCDETNNTAAVVDRNEFIANIFIKPARSINYVTLNFVAVRTGVDFEEVVGTV